MSQISVISVSGARSADRQWLARVVAELNAVKPASKSQSRRFLDAAA
jgi:hypothetical protein